MSEIVDIVELANTAKSVFSKVKDLIPRKHGSDISKFHQILGDIQTSYISLHQDYRNLHQEHSDLLEKYRQLAENNRRNKDKGLDKSAYAPFQARGALVMVPKGEIRPMYCQKCFEENHLVALQGIPGSFESMGSHWCPTCQIPLRVL